ncbi:MAG TPA: hypothetical protein VEL11_11655 [Candidatus Bathyarchaeia archaeon]|nr:hypothetical protein [Candidatus Bathyarchaeia archaeon]
MEQVVIPLDRNVARYVIILKMGRPMVSVLRARPRNLKYKVKLRAKKEDQQQRQN